MSFREIIRQHPFIRILFPFTIGVVIADKYTVNPHITIIFLLVSSFSIIILAANRKLRKDRTASLIFGVFITLFFFSLGLIRISQTNNNMYLSVPEDCNIYKVRIDDYAVRKTKTDMLPITVLQAYYQQKIYPQKVKAIIYIPKNKTNLQLKPNDCLWINAALKKITGNGNPYEFNYARYLRNKHILYRGYLQKKQYRLIDTNLFSLRGKALFWRKKLLQIYKSKGITNANYDILSALTLGNKTNLDPEIKQAWSNAGAIHVLAVSGLHVGIIYLIANLLLQYLLRWKYGRWIRAVLLLIILWLYALITGLSPSVMRASCMFSFIVFGSALHRQTAILNSLTASAALLLVYDPYLLFSAGFQFSYLAVFGIVLLQPGLEQLIYIPGRIPFFFWRLTTVTLSAQLSTFPLSIYYFHQFPSYFLLSSYVVILSAGILIYLSAFLLFFHKINFIADSLGWILQHLTNTINKTVIAIQKLPGAVLQNCYFSAYETFILYMILISSLFIFIGKSKKAVFALLIFLILLGIPPLIQKTEPSRNEFVVFNTNKNTLLAFRTGQNVLFLCSKEIETEQIKRLTTPYILTNRIKNSTIKYLHNLDGVTWHNKNYIIIGEEEPFIDTLLTKYPPSFLVIRKRGLQNANITNNQNIKIIIDNSVSIWDIKKNNLTADNIFLVKKSGAFVINNP